MLSKLDTGMRDDESIGRVICIITASVFYLECEYSKQFLQCHFPLFSFLAKFPDGPWGPPEPEQPVNSTKNIGHTAIHLK